MADLRVDISMEFKFMFVETHAEVITGKQEGVYAWIAINYVLGKFDHSIGCKLYNITLYVLCFNHVNVTTFSDTVYVYTYFIISD